MSDASAPSSRSLTRYGIGAGVIAIAIAAVGIASRVNADRALGEIAADNAIPSVTVIRAEQGKGGDALILPGNVQALNSAALYARTNGYVRRWVADIGDRVSAGQTLAIIDAPEVDQQLAQAQADYQTSLANQALAKTTAVRWDALLEKDAVSKQEADERRGDLAARTAVANAAAANVRRLKALQGFTRIEAPFDGVVSSRSAQIGALVAAGNAAAQPLFTVSDIRRMRIYVRVPQGYSAGIKAGMHAIVTVPEFPGREFDAVLTRTADAVDPSSGTVLVEVQAANPDSALKPGAYAQVRFPNVDASSISIPASALLFREEGTLLATLDNRNRVRLRPITIGRDNGASIEVSNGLSGNERIIDTPPDAIAEGDEVRPQKAAAPKAKG